MGIVVVNQNEHTWAVSMKYCISIGGDTINGFTRVQEWTWIPSNDAPIRLENKGIAKEVTGPEVVNVLFLHIGNDRVIIGWINCTIVGLKGLSCIGQLIGPRLCAKIDEQEGKQHCLSYY
jgi:hypothetical protein